MSSAASMIYPNNDVPTGRTSMPATTRTAPHQRCQRRNSLPRTFPSQHHHQQQQHRNCSNNNRKQYSDWWSDCFVVPPTINAGAGQSTVSTATSTVSLHYISQFLTPDTLILPRQFSFTTKPSSSTTCPYSNSDHLLQRRAPPTNFCRHHHHHHNPNHHHLPHHQDDHHRQQQQQIHLDMKMVSEHRSMMVNPMSNDHCGTDSAVDAATAQLEEIIRLCRTLQQTKTNNNNNGNNSGTTAATANGTTAANDQQNQYHHHHHCSGCCGNIRLGCRCSADCVQYFIGNEEFMADMTKAAAAMAVMNGVASEPSPTLHHGDDHLPPPPPESIDDLKQRSTRNTDDYNDQDDDQDDVEPPCQLLLLSNMDSGIDGGNCMQMETANKNNENIDASSTTTTNKSVLSTTTTTTVRSTPTILLNNHHQHLQPKHPQQHRNIEVNVNNNDDNCNNNGGGGGSHSHFVTELVAKFEDKQNKNMKKPCSTPPPSPPTRSSRSSPPSSSSSSSSNLPSTTASSPSSLDTMMKNNHNHHDHDHNHNNRPFRDKHQTDTFSDQPQYHDQQQPKSTTVSSSTVLSSTTTNVATNLNAKRVQLPQSSSTVLSSIGAMPSTSSSSSSDLIQEEEKICDSATDFSMLLNNKNNINQTTPLVSPPPTTTSTTKIIRTKPKPPPKPSSLMLLSASSNPSTTTATTIINARNKNTTITNPNDNEGADDDPKCHRLSLLLNVVVDQQKSSSTTKTVRRFNDLSLASGKDALEDDCINGATADDAKCDADDQSSSSSTSLSSPSALPDPLICPGDNKIGIHGSVQANKNDHHNDKSKEVVGNLDEIEIFPLSSSSPPTIGNMPGSLVDDSTALCPQQSNDLPDRITRTMKTDGSLDSSEVELKPPSSTTMAQQPSNKCQSYCCCCCCCPSSGSYGGGTCSNNGNHHHNNSKLLGIDLCKIHSTISNNNHQKLMKPARKLPPPSSLSSSTTTTNMNHGTSSATTIVDHHHQDDDSDLIRQDHHHHHHHHRHLKQPPQQPQHLVQPENNHPKSNSIKSINKCSNVVVDPLLNQSNESDVLVIVGDERLTINDSDEQNGLGSSSDNSSSDEGIENPAILDDEEDDIDDDDDEVVDLLNKSNTSCHYPHNHNHNNHNNRRNHSSHSHHQHHFNHHNQLVNHHQHHHHPSDPNRKSPSLSLKSNRTVSPLFPQSTNPDDVHQAEKFLNGTDSKHLKQLKQEETLLLQEIFELETEQSETSTTTATAAAATGVTSSSDHNNEEEEDVDEELLEFQRIEREIKLSELRKCLQIVQKQIKSYQTKLEQEEEEEIIIDNITTTNTEDFDSITMATTATNSDSGSSVNKLDHQLDQAQQQVEKNINTLIQSKSSSAMAPLAEPEMDEMSKTDSLEPEVIIINPELDLSDSDESDAEEVLEQQPIITPIGQTHINNNNNNDTQRSLDDLLHESIETRLEKVNDVSEQEQECFVANSGRHKLPEQETSSALTRRTSRYDNEKPHDCRMKHFGYQRNVDMLMLKSAYQKLDLDKYDSETDIKHMMMNNASSISNEMLESTTTATDSESDSIVLRRRSARFPADDSTTDSNSNPHLQSQDELSTHSDQPVLRNKRISAVSSNSSTAVGGGTAAAAAGGSQRPLTLYMPAPNQKINLITHLHALGHDLTSSIVTNHLLLTPYTCSGYLYKHCSSGVGKWRKRYFHFDRVRKVFVYYHDRADFEKMRHPKRGVFFDEIQDVYVDHTRINMKKFLSNSNNDKHSTMSNQQKYGSPGAMTSPAKADGTRCVFVVSTATFSRKFILSTFTPELMRIWMDVIFTGAQAYLQDFDDQLMN